MPTREEKIAFLQSRESSGSSRAPTSTPGAPAKTREEKLAFIQSKAVKDPGFLESAMGAIASAADAVDSYTGAPARAAIGALQDGKNPITAGMDAFGADPKTVPTGKQIAAKAGLNTEESIALPTVKALRKALTFQLKPEEMNNDPELGTKVSPAGMAGVGIELLADPTNLIPGAAALKGTKVGAKALAKGANAAGDVAKAAGQTVKALPGAQTAGTAGKMAVDGVSNTASALKKMFTPTQAPDYKELLDVARKNNIDPKLLPESVEFGEASFISRAARNRAEGVLGETHLKKFEEGLDAVREATERKVHQISGGSAPSSVEAGELIRKGYDDGVSKLFDNVGMTHNKIVESIPGLKMSPEAISKIDSKLNGIEKWAKGRAERGFTAAQREQAKQVIAAVNAVRSSKVPEKTLTKVTRGGKKGSEWVTEDLYSYKRLVETLREIGDVAFKSQNVLADIPPDVSKFRDLYHAINEGLIDTVRHSAGAPVADELVASNKLITDFLGDKSTIAGVVGNRNMSPERVFTALVEHGDTAKIKALKRILPPETFKRLKGAFLASQIKRSADGGFTFKSLHNNLRNKKTVMAEILDGNEIAEFADLIRLGDRFGNPVLSTSGTGGSSLFRNITEGIRSGLESDTVIGTLKESARKRALNPPAKVLKGEDKWASDGLKKAESALKGVDQQALLSNKKTRNMLIHLSGLTVGSKAFANVINKLKSESSAKEQK